MLIHPLVLEIFESPRYSVYFTHTQRIPPNSNVDPINCKLKQANSITGLRGIGWAKGKLAKSGLCFTSKSTDA